MSQQQSQSSSFAHSSADDSALDSPKLSHQGQAFAAEAAERYGFSESAVAAMLTGMARGGGDQAQFDHPELGGLGQWSRGGMLMIGDMFNDGLKARVGALAQDAATGFAAGGLFEPAAAKVTISSWPSEFGTPNTSGSQNDLQYAFFPEARRLLIARGGAQEIYDTGDHQILGVSQQQGGPARLSFASQHGPISLDSLHRVDGSVSGPAAGASARREPVGSATPPASAAQVPDDAASASSPPISGEHQAASIIAAIEGIAGLHAKGILSDEEFSTKKAELLSRL